MYIKEKERMNYLNKGIQEQIFIICQDTMTVNFKLFRKKKI